MKAEFHNEALEQLAPLRLYRHKSYSVTESKQQLSSIGFEAVSCLLHLQRLLAVCKRGYTRTHLVISCDIMQCTHHIASSLK